MIIHIIAQIVPYWIFVGMSPILYMEDLGVSLSHFGYYQGSLAFIFAIGSLISGLLIKRYDQKKMLYISGQIFIIGFLSTALVTLTNSSNPLLITLALLPFIIGQIIPTTVLYPLALNFMPLAKGKVSAILYSGRLIFTAISLQVAGYFYQGTFRSIGIIILGFIFVAVVTLFCVLKNRELMRISQE